MLVPVTASATLYLPFIERYHASTLIVVYLLSDSEHQYGSDEKTFDYILSTISKSSDNNTLCFGTASLFHKKICRSMRAPIHATTSKKVCAGERTLRINQRMIMLGALISSILIPETIFAASYSITRFWSFYGTLIPL